MSKLLRIVSILTTPLVAALFLATAQAQSPAGGEVTMSKQSALELLQQMDTLQNEVRELRNKVEVQANELARLQAAQRDLLTATQVLGRNMAVKCKNRRRRLVG